MSRDGRIQKIKAQRGEIATVLTQKLFRGPGGLTDFPSFGNFEGNINQRNSYQGQRECQNDIRVEIPKIKICHRSFLSNLYDIHKQNVPNNKSKVNNPISLSPISLSPLTGQKLGETTTRPNQPADKFMESPDNAFVIAFLSFLVENKFIYTNLTRN